MVVARLRHGVSLSDPRAQRRLNAFRSPRWACIACATRIDVSKPQRSPPVSSHSWRYGRGELLVLGILVSGPHAHAAAWPGPTVVFSEMMTRTLGLLVDQEYGLVIYAPIYLSAIVGAIALLRTRRDVAAAALLTVAVYVRSSSAR